SRVGGSGSGDRDHPRLRAELGPQYELSSRPEGARRGGGMRYTVIGVGTNSGKFHMGELNPEGTWRTVVDRAEVTRLGEGLHEHGRLGAEPIRRTAEAIGGMTNGAGGDGGGDIGAV